MNLNVACLSAVNRNCSFRGKLTRLDFAALVPDALVAMEKAMKRDKIIVNDRQLACARIASPEGQDYLKGMAAAGNYAWVNRSSMTFLTRQVQSTLLFCSKSFMMISALKHSAVQAGCGGFCL